MPGSTRPRRATAEALVRALNVLTAENDAFYLPSSGSMPRQLVEDSSLPRALALRQSGSQLVSLIGGPAGGALVAFAGFTAASMTDSVSFGVVLIALVAIRTRFTPLGTGTFVCNLGPVLMGTAPRSPHDSAASRSAVPEVAAPRACPVWRSPQRNQYNFGEGR
jgi:hypothetical protein